MSTMTPQPMELLFVYNADSGLFNAVADAAHKVFSPATYQCNLCKVTYGWLTERTAWRRFVAELPVRCTFLHRDELKARYRTLNVALPAVLCITNDTPAVCLDADALGGCADVDDLIGLVRARCLGG